MTTLFDKNLGTINELGRKKQVELAKVKYAQVYNFIIQVKEESSQELSLREIANTLNEAGFKTRQGKEFTAMQVKRILDRVGVPGYSEKLENTEKRSAELEKLFKQEQKKFGKALLEINVFKAENEQLKEKLENAKVAIRALETERDRQLDLVSMERSRLLKQIERMSEHVDNISQELDRYKKESERLLSEIEGLRQILPLLFPKNQSVLNFS